MRSNASMWREYEEVSKSRRVEVVWIKGHAGDPHNALVDRLARKQARLALAELAQNAPVSSVTECGVGAIAISVKQAIRLGRRHAQSQRRGKTVQGPGRTRDGLPLRGAVAPW